MTIKQKLKEGEPLDRHEILKCWREYAVKKTITLDQYKTIINTNKYNHDVRRKQLTKEKHDKTHSDGSDSRKEKQLSCWENGKGW